MVSNGLGPSNPSLLEMAYLVPPQVLVPNSVLLGRLQKVFSCGEFFPGVSVTDSGEFFPGVSVTDSGEFFPGVSVTDSGEFFPGVSVTDSGEFFPDEQLYYSFQGKLRLVVCNQEQVCNVLKECHDNLGSGGHPGRRRTTEKVLASYHWKTLRDDVQKWVNRSVFETLGVKHCITSAYHPQANGQDERTNRNIKEALAKYCEEGQNDWDAHLKVSKKEEDDNSIVVSDVTEEHLEAKTREVADLHAKIYQNIKIAQDRQKKAFETHKGRNVKSFHFQIGDEVLKANKRKEGRKGGQLERNWSGPYVIASISEKGVATLANTTGAPLKQSRNVSQLKPFIKPNLRDSKEPEGSVKKENNNWVPKDDSFQAHGIAPCQWKVKFGRDIKGFPHQTTGNNCGIYILMNALSLSTDAPFWCTERDMARIRTWWCINLMERFQIDGHGQRFAYWTNEATALLQGSLQPIYRIPKTMKRDHEVSMMLMAKDTQCHAPFCYRLINAIQIPTSVLYEILKEVVLQEGDKCFLTLALDMLGQEKGEYCKQYILKPYIQDTAVTSAANCNRLSSVSLPDLPVSTLLASDYSSLALPARSSSRFQTPACPTPRLLPTYCHSVHLSLLLFLLHTTHCEPESPQPQKDHPRRTAPTGAGKTRPRGNNRSAPHGYRGSTRGWISPRSHRSSSGWISPRSHRSGSGWISPRSHRSGSGWISPRSHRSGSGWIPPRSHRSGSGWISPRSHRSGSGWIPPRSHRSGSGWISPRSHRSGSGWISPRSHRSGSGWISPRSHRSGSGWISPRSHRSGSGWVSPPSHRSGSGWISPRSRSSSSGWVSPRSPQQQQRVGLPPQQPAALRNSPGKSGSNAPLPHNQNISSFRRKRKPYN
ncbi:Gypsy retrotransposon integrase-like protein 1 [Merluccius polli]|uniref:Gypsy retrotransposon integrase-like protein 1 n=1 Tax=Merluccius polli TaxID=89951 RepID=A0AA47P918_MERPO|nr:Gypsy retrotransposon integrase-like protein 1 [Merluccius polli]